MTSQQKRHQDETKDGDGPSLRHKTSHHHDKQLPISNISGPSSKMDKVVENIKHECVNNISNYLDHNEGFLESYIINNVPINQLQRWINQKRCISSINEPRFEKICKKDNFVELVKMLKEDTDEHAIVISLTRLICMSIEVDAFKIYKLSDHDSSVQYFDTVPDQVLPTRLVKEDSKNIEHVLQVAQNGSCLRLARDGNTATFPEIPIALLKAFGVEKAEEANHVLYQPLFGANWKTVYVIEMWSTKKKFDDEDFNANLITWGSIILQYCNLYMDKNRERKMSDFMFEVVEDVFEEKVSLSQVIKKILECAQKMIKADGASLFLVDKNGHEVFLVDYVHGSGPKKNLEKRDVKMPINSGIVGRVALSGETMNIHNAYSDPSFNSDVDKTTGYTTKHLLCIPVKVQGEVIAVIQVANKINNERFDDEDEIAFKQFSTFFGLVLHHARLNDDIKKLKNIRLITSEIMSYHNTCKESEVNLFLENNQDINVPVDSLYNFYLDPYKLNDIQKCKAVTNMFYDLFERSKFDYKTLTRFILTVKKNYRAVPYHNFDHGWSVTQAMYVIIKKDCKNDLDDKMKLALFVSSLCHDIDHQGYTAEYLNKIASPLAAMYSSSALEHYHFNFTSTILRMDGHNLFSQLTKEDHKITLRYIKECILATNLTSFHNNKAKLDEMCSLNSQCPSFDWANPNHRELGMAISMTAADLSASAKPWDIQLKTVNIIFEEFYAQGDKEKKAGITPIAMMDRNKTDEQPASQEQCLCILWLLEILISGNQNLRVVQTFLKIDGFKFIKYDSGSSEEEQDSKVITEAKEIQISKEIEGNMVNDEGVVTR